MTILIDTNIAIYLRDGAPMILERVAALAEPFAISIITRVELEGGIDREPMVASRQRAKLDELIAAVEVLDFGAREAAAYGRIVAAAGYSRNRILDRMIAATAIVHGAPLITINGDDFRGIDGLRLEIWKAIAA